MSIRQSSPKQKKVTFTFMCVPGRKVFVAGSFNKWDPAAIPLTDCNGMGVYTATMLIPKGRHEYKFVVDDIWQVDPVNTESIANESGTMNSVIVV